MQSLENLSLRYPHELVRQFGAKARLLMYVAEHLPDIPQMPMVVKKLGEREEDFLKRANEANIGWPRIFRSSAVVELLGYEGEFPTFKISRHKRYQNDPPTLVKDGNYTLFATDEELEAAIEDEVRKIATSPKSIYNPEDKLPEEINVMVAEVAPSHYHGTFIQHPNNPDFYIATVSDRQVTTTFTYDQDGTLQGFGGSFRKPLEFYERIHQGLRRIFGWHDRIASLPEMDPDWAYQIEFGLDPEILFQVRPFKKKVIAPFTLLREGTLDWDPEPPIVIGITPEEGLDFTLWHKLEMDTKHTSPNILFTELRRVVDIKERVNNWQAYLLEDGGGILKHADVRVIRHSPLTVIYQNYASFPATNGSKIHIVSDGKIVKITDKTTDREFKSP